eukprot:TRINITY_DN48199_c0_g1_i1.p1 TRINITY_DN48199_c0_g1~~TRINITY_DN48199_c0_g1_i1.p1  ORF type:complete len:481 (-),score=60.28 TRINITY_DN48199_c0_g1_i1:239-1645(-)
MTSRGNLAERHIVAVFQKWDAAGTGFITEDQLRPLLRDAGIAEAEISNVFASADVGRDGKLDYREFSGWLLNNAPQSVLDEIKEEVSWLEGEDEAEELRVNPEGLLEKMFDAINDGNVSVVRASLDANRGTKWEMPIDIVDHDGNTPLSDASCYGELEIVRLLLERRAHPDVQNSQGRTPLWRACYNGHIKVMRALLECGADPSIAAISGGVPGKHGTVESKALLASWDIAETRAIRKRLGLENRTAAPQLWSVAEEQNTLAQRRHSLAQEAKALAHGGAPISDEDRETLRNGSKPIKIQLRQLPSALEAAHEWGKVPLVVCNGVEPPEQFLFYTGEALIDAKQVIGEVYIQRTKTVEEMQDALKQKLLAAMETHGHGLTLHIRMADTACDFKRTFCAPSKFPQQVFGGANFWNDEEVTKQFNDPRIIVQPEFNVIVTSTFTMSEVVQHLADKLPFFDQMALIDIVVS